MGGNSVYAPRRRRRRGNGEQRSDSHRRDEERLARPAGRRGKAGRKLHGRGLNGAGCVGRGRVARGLLDAVFQGVHHRECRQRRGPANVPLSCWRGFAAAPHRGGATSKAVPISFSGVLAGLWGGRGLVGGAGALRPWLERGSRCAVWAWTAARPACRRAASLRCSSSRASSRGHRRPCPRGIQPGAWGRAAYASSGYRSEALPAVTDGGLSGGEADGHE